MNPLALARPAVRALVPYSSARMEAAAGRIWLNANESPWPPARSDAAWNRYPDPQPPALLRRLGDVYGAAPEQVLAGRGSDEAIDLLVRAFCEAGRDAVMISPPTFGMYAVSARVQGAEVIEVPLRGDFTPDTAALLAAMSPRVKLVFACSPNNPAGAGVPRASLLGLAKSLAGRALLVVDEAYIEFADCGGGFGSVAPGLAAHPNLVVLRTLSKAWALAGVRIGAMLADARIVGLLRKLMPPYPLPSPCVEIALAALSAQGWRVARERARRVCAERTRVAGELAAMDGVRSVLPSQANFLAVRFIDADVALRALQDAGVVVRDIRHHAGLADALRITMGTPGENDAVLAALRRLPARGRAKRQARGTARA